MGFWFYLSIASKHFNFHVTIFLVLGLPSKKNYPCQLKSLDRWIQIIVSRIRWSSKAEDDKITEDDDLDAGVEYSVVNAKANVVQRLDGFALFTLCFSVLYPTSGFFSQSGQIRIMGVLPKRTLKDLVSMILDPKHLKRNSKNFFEMIGMLGMPDSLVKPVGNCSIFCLIPVHHINRIRFKSLWAFSDHNFTGKSPKKF